VVLRSILDDAGQKSAWAKSDSTECGPSLEVLEARFWIVGSEEARVKRWPPSAAQTARTVFPYAAFTKTQRRQDAREGIK